MTKLIVAFALLQTLLRIKESAKALSKTGTMILDVYSELLAVYEFSKETERKYRILKKFFFDK
jgi:hypothetical protein